MISFFFLLVVVFQSGFPFFCCCCCLPHIFGQKKKEDGRGHIPVVQPTVENPSVLGCSRRGRWVTKVVITGRLKKKKKKTIVFIFFTTTHVEKKKFSKRERLVICQKHYFSIYKKKNLQLSYYICSALISYSSPLCLCVFFFSCVENERKSIWTRTRECLTHINWLPSRVFWHNIGNRSRTSGCWLRDNWLKVSNPIGVETILSLLFKPSMRKFRMSQTSFSRPPL